MASRDIGQEISDSDIDKQEMDKQEMLELLKKLRPLLDRFAAWDRRDKSVSNHGLRMADRRNLQRAANARITGGTPEYEVLDFISKENIEWDL